MEPRPTEQVFEDHLALAQAGDVETDLNRNFAPDVVLLTSYGVFHGHEGCRKAAELLDVQIGKTQYTYRTKLFHGELAFLEWSASTDLASVEDGADSYLIKAGRIHVMAIHYTVTPRHKSKRASGAG
jgi:hypothetical protein